ncbi:MAG: iron chelate uptake ABC transporter family permease subunit [Pseudonocardiaceae bacterium]|nr:iron chelate uptake ABC transporter family permease subunit [Pseudonocardiaceae bacterium]
MSQIDFGRSVRVVRVARDRITGRFDTRSLIVSGVLAVAIVCVLVVSLGTGDVSVSPWRVVRVVFGGGDAPERLVVLQWRMPRALMAVVAGAALAVSGAIFQAMTRNPLGSPDVIGFTSGAYAGAVLSILVLRGSGLSTPVGALLGGLATAMAVYLLAYRRGVEGFRLIIVGIGVSTILAAITTWLMMRAQLELAIQAAVWGTGTIAGTTWWQLGYVSIATSVLIPLALAAAPTLRALGMGEDAARALGTRVRTAMLALTVLGVAMSAAVVAFCGMIMFISLAAPQLARRAAQSGELPLISSALMGALLLSGSDWIAQHGLGEEDLPVGVVTVSVGGAYLIWLLIREARRR